MPGIVTELTPAVQTRCRGTRIFLSYALASHFSAPSGHLANCNAIQKVPALPNLFQWEKFGRYFRSPSKVLPGGVPIIRHHQV